MHAKAIVEDNELHLLYQIDEGPCDQSFGVHVAKLTHFPSAIIEVKVSHQCPIFAQMAEQKAKEFEEYETILGTITHTHTSLLTRKADSREDESSEKRADTVMHNFIQQFKAL